MKTHYIITSKWGGFVGIVLALSGVEAIANATGVMRLDPGSTEARPSVRKTSTPALLWVMVEVCLFTALLGLAMQIELRQRIFVHFAGVEFFLNLPHAQLPAALARSSRRSGRR